MFFSWSDRKLEESLTWRYCARSCQTVMVTWSLNTNGLSRSEVHKVNRASRNVIFTSAQIGIIKAEGKRWDGCRALRGVAPIVCPYIASIHPSIHPSIHEVMLLLLLLEVSPLNLKLHKYVKLEVSAGGLVSAKVSGRDDVCWWSSTSDLWHTSTGCLTNKNWHRIIFPFDPVEHHKQDLAVRAEDRLFRHDWIKKPGQSASVLHSATGKRWNRIWVDLLRPGDLL